MNILVRIPLILIFCIPFFSLFGQNVGSNNVLQKAHDQKVFNQEVIVSSAGLFHIHIYTTDKKAVVGKTHHWFIKLTDPKGYPLNFANITLSGYLKSNPATKFNYQHPVFPLCTEGKYIIGFVKTQQPGTWLIEATVNNFDHSDQFTSEITISDPPSVLAIQE